MANSEAERRLELAPTFGEILRSCQADTRSILRNIENVSYKLNNAITAVDFNTSCISNGLLPQHINIYTLLYYIYRVTVYTIQI